MTKNGYVATSCSFELIEDDWNKGEGKVVSSWTEDIPSSDTVVGVLQKVPYLDCNVDPSICLFDIFENDPIHEDDYSRFDGDVLVDIDSSNEHITRPSDDKWLKFQKGECKLYVLHISLRIKKNVDLDMNDVSQFLD